MPEATKKLIDDVCKAKSDQLNADDLKTGPITVTIEAVHEGTSEQPVVIHISGGHMPYKPSKGMIRIMADEHVWKDDPFAWKGQWLTLYRNPDVIYAGKKEGGIEISHMTGIDKPTEFSVTVSRGRKKTITILPLVVESPPETEVLSEEDKAMIEQLTADIATSDTMETLKAVGFILKNKPKPIQNALRAAYGKRQVELKAPENLDSEPE